MAKLRILVVEDEAIVAESIRACLEDHGYEVPAVLDSGEEAVARFAEIAPDMAVMDIRLAGRMDGIEAALKMQAAAPLPVVILTAYSDRATLERAREVQPAAYLVKPFSEHELKAAVELGVRRHEMTRKLADGERLLRLSQQAAGAGSWEWDLRTNRHVWSEELWKVYGVEPHSCEPSYEAWLRTIHPDDRERTARAVAEAAASGTELNAEWRVRDPGGAERWLMSRGQPQRDADGRVVRYVGIVIDITDRKRAEAALAESGRQLREIAENLNEVLYSVDVDGRITYISPVITSVTGHRPEEMVGRPFADFIHPEDLPVLQKDFEETLAGALKPSEFRVQVSSGGFKWVRSSSRPVLVDGRPTGLRGVVADIHDERLAKEALWQAEQKYRQIVESAAEGIWLIDTDGRTVLVNASMAGMLGYGVDEMIGRHLFDFMSAEMKAAAAELMERRKQGVAERHDFEFLRKDGRSVQAMLSTSPLRNKDGAFVGALACVTDITERKRAEQELRAAQSRTASVLESIADTFYSLDDQWRFTMINPAAEKAPFGRPASELLGKCIWEAYPKLVGTPIHQHYLRAAAQKCLEHYEAQSPLNGRWYEVFMQGWALGVDVYMRDVTERRLADQALRESEERFRSIIEAAPEAIFVQSDGRFVYVNPAMIRLLGAKGPGELIGREFMDFIAPEFREAIRERIRMQRETGRATPLMEQAYLRVDGSRVPVETTAVGIHYEGKDAHLVFVRDVSRRRRGEVALRESRERLELAMRAAGMGLWDWDIVNDRRTFAPRTCALLGIDPARFSGAAEDFFRVVHPEDRDSLRAALARTVSGGYLYETEYRVVLPNGDLRCLRARGRLVKGADGKPAKITGLLWDVTARRQAEERYRLLFETMLNGFALHEIILDEAGKPRDYRFLEVNRAFEEMTGLKRDQVVGRTVREAIPGIEDFWIERYGRVALTGEPVRFEAEAAALGKWFSVFAYSPRKGSFATMFEDVTARKRAEQSLAGERAHKDAILASMADAVFTATGAGAIRTCNQRALEMLGYRSGELVGRSLGFIFAQEDDLPHRGGAKLSEALRRGEIRDYDTRLKRHDGSSVPVSLSCALLARTGSEDADIVVVARDISSRKRLQDEQRAYAARLEEEVAERTREILHSEGRYRALFQNIDHAVVTTGRDGAVQSCNAAAERLFGAADAELAGRRIAELIGCEDCAMVADQVRKLGAWTHECVLTGKSGERLPLHLSVSAIRGEEGDVQGLVWLIANLAERERLEEEARQAQDYVDLMLREAGPRGKLVGKGKAHRALVRSVKECAAAPSPVLVLGESGVGKEVVARSIHLNGPRAEKPFVVVDCASIQGSLLERELFGHEKGAYTGAGEARRGLVEVANGGTLFVDEIGEMPMELQPKLLRVLERGEFRRLGSTRETSVDIRVLAATNRDLAAAVKKKQFRADLFFRLNVLRVDIPPLRERKEDIPALAQHFLENCRVTIPSRKKLGREALRQLEAYDWPGNVRELANVIERAIIVSGDEGVISPRHLPLEVVLAGTGAATAIGSASGRAEVKTLEQAEHEAIAQALSAAGGNKTKAAAMLGISRTTLHQKLEKYGIGKA